MYNIGWMTSLCHSERSEESHAALCQVSDLRIPVSESPVSFLTGQVMTRVIGFSTLPVVQGLPLRSLRDKL